MLWIVKSIVCLKKNDIFNNVNLTLTEKAYPNKTT